MQIHIQTPQRQDAKLRLLGLVAMFVLAYSLHMLLGRQGRFPARGI